MAMSAASGAASSSCSAASSGSCFLAPARYSPLTENDVVSTWTCSALTSKIWRACLAIPAKSLVGSCAYDQSSVGPRQSTLSHLGLDLRTQQVLDRDARRSIAGPNTIAGC